MNACFLLNRVVDVIISNSSSIKAEIKPLPRRRRRCPVAASWGFREWPASAAPQTATRSRTALSAARATIRSGYRKHYAFYGLRWIGRGSNVKLNILKSAWNLTRFWRCAGNFAHRRYSIDYSQLTSSPSARSPRPALYPKTSSAHLKCPGDNHSSFLNVIDRFNWSCEWWSLIRCANFSTIKRLTEFCQSYNDTFNYASFAIVNGLQLKLSSFSHTAQFEWSEAQK